VGYNRVLDEEEGGAEALVERTNFMNLTKAFSVPPLLWRLRTTPERPRELVDLVFGNRIISPLQVREELLEFGEVVSKLKPKVVLEIGTARGGTLCVLSRLADPCATIVSVDLPGGEFGGGYKWFHVPIFKRLPLRGQKLHLLRADSHDPESFSRVERVLDGRQLDLLFIDGDHSYDGVRQDFEVYSRLVRPGGLVAFHDVAKHRDPTCQVSRFWDEVKERYQYTEVIRDRNQGWAGIGLLYL
jgi:predicted O-methyltransferase YrrM